MPFSPAQQDAPTQQQAARQSALAPKQLLPALDAAPAAWQDEQINSLEPWLPGAGQLGAEGPESAAQPAGASQAATGKPGTRAAALSEGVTPRNGAAYGDGGSAAPRMGVQGTGGTVQHMDIAVEAPGAGSGGFPAGAMAGALSSIFSSGCAESTMDAFLSTLSYT